MATVKKIIIISFLVLLSIPFPADAQEQGSAHSVYFKAKVIAIIKEEKKKLPDASEAIQQNIRLRALDSKYKDNLISINGIGDFDNLSKNVFKLDDIVLVQASFDEQGGEQFYITDYERSFSIYILFGVFVAFMLAVSGFKGIRSLLSLALTFVVIMNFMLPAFIGGMDPVLISLLGSFCILIAVIYLTEGFKREANLAIISILFSLAITALISWLFTSYSHLSGLSSEEAGFLAALGGKPIDFRGLLLAGIIIGSIGVLDDVVISQIAVVKEIDKANRLKTFKELYASAYKIGISHISSMTNTLFLAYTGASLPLLLLFLSNQSSFSSAWQAINNEAIATEIVRTLAGSIGLISAVPIATVIAVWNVKRKKI